MRERVLQAVAPIRGVFANRELRRIELAFAGSVVGLYAYYIAIAVFAYRHGGATAVGVLTLVRLLAAAAVAPFAASLADRHRRERVMLVSNLGRAAAVAGAAGAAFAELPPIAVYALATAVSVIGTPFRPAEASLLPELARTPDELTAANATSSTFDSVGCFLGPAIAGFLLAVASPAAVFVVTAVGFLWSSLFIAAVHPKREPEQADGEGRPGHDLLAGLRAIAHEPRLRLLLGLYGAQCLVAGALGVLVVVTALQLLKIGSSGLGFLESATGIGSLVGAGVALALVRRKRLAGDLGIGILLWGAPLVVIGLAAYLPVAVLALGVVGIGNTLVDIAAMTLLQRTVAEDVAGRVFGVLESVIVGSLGLGAILAPALIGLFGIRAALVCTGAFLPVLAALSWRRLSAIDEGARVPPERVETFRHVPFLRTLPLGTLELLALHADAVALDPGDILFRKGDAGDRFYVLDEGSLAVELPIGTKIEQAPSFVGEIALLRDVPRTATVSSPSGARLWAVDRTAFLAAVTGHARSHAAGQDVATARMGIGPAA